MINERWQMIAWIGNKLLIVSHKGTKHNSILSNDFDSPR